MKYLMLSFFAVLFFVACDNSPKQLGEKFTAQKTISVDEVASQLQSQPTLQAVQIEGIIDKSCKGEGCWFTIKDAQGTEILFDIKDKKFKVPTNSPGKTAIVLADAEVDSTADQKFNLLVKGLMFK